jgi:hypothetical protein
MDRAMLDRGRPLSLWGLWWNAIQLLRPAFSRLSAFMWFATIVAGITVRVDTLGITSIVRALNLRPKLHHRLLAHFHSTGVKLIGSQLFGRSWRCGCSQSCARQCRLVLVGDGIKIPKRGRKIPAVKLLHQQSESNTKPEYIMGHSLQAVGLLLHATQSVFCVPLAPRIHEGLVWSNRDRQGHHLVSRVKSNAVAYAPAPPKKGRNKRGRPKINGEKTKLKVLACGYQIDAAACQSGLRRKQHHSSLSSSRSVVAPGGTACPLCGHHSSHKGACLLMCTDTSLSAIDIIRLYGLRFKIEHSFKQAASQIGSFAYHFWIKDMIPLLYRNGNQYLHRKSADYRSHVKRKTNAYHVFIQAGVIAQGLLQYLAVASPKLVGDSFGSWLRTIRPGIPRSEFVVANALRQTLPEFLMSYSEAGSLTKFIADRQDNGNLRIFRLAS